MKYNESKKELSETEVLEIVRKLNGLSLTELNKVTSCEIEDIEMGDGQVSDVSTAGDPLNFELRVIVNYYSIRMK